MRKYGIIRVATCRRDGGVVDRTGLENRRAARSRGFESLSLRQSVEAGVMAL